MAPGPYTFWTPSNPFADKNWQAPTLTLTLSAAENRKAANLNPSPGPDPDPDPKPNPNPNPNPNPAPNPNPNPDPKPNPLEGAAGELWREEDAILLPRPGDPFLNLSCRLPVLPQAISRIYTYLAWRRALAVVGLLSAELAYSNADQPVAAAAQRTQGR